MPPPPHTHTSITPIPPTHPRLPLELLEPKASLDEGLQRALYIACGSAIFWTIYEQTIRAMKAVDEVAAAALLDKTKGRTR